MPYAARLFPLFHSIHGVSSRVASLSTAGLAPAFVELVEPTTDRQDIAVTFAELRGQMSSARQEIGDLPGA